MNKENQIKIYFISGISGVGKTTVLSHLKKNLDSNKYDVHDIDERGVPDGGGLEWLNKETRYWLDFAKENASQGKNTVICGFANPELFEKIYKKDEDVPAKLILLHASGETIEKRLRSRHSTPESIREIERMAGIPVDEFIRNNVNFSTKFYSIFKKRGYPIINTDGKTPKEVSEEVVKLIRNWLF